MANRLLRRLSAGPMLGAEGYLFELERRGWVSIGPFVPEVVLDSPDAVKQLHREFVRAGSDVIEAFTYYGHREKLKLVNKEHILKDLNFKAIEIASEVKDEFYSQYPTYYNDENITNELFIAGNICNSTHYYGKEQTSQETIDKIHYMFSEQVGWAMDNPTGNMVDFIIGETYDYLEEALIALECVKGVSSKVYGVDMPCVINLVIHSAGKTLDGYTPQQACVVLAEQGSDVVGLNCARGPDTMLPLLRDIKETMEKNGLGHVPIAALPVCYRTDEMNPTFQSLTDKNDKKKQLCDLDCHTCTRFDIYDFTKECLDLGVQYLGVCCGGAPHHVRSMAEAMGKVPLSSKYNPNIDLHYALGSNDEETIKSYL